MIGNLKFKVKEYLPKSQKVSRIVKATICFVIALIITGTIYITQENQNQLVTVIKPSRIITAGTKISEDDLKKVEVGEYNLPEDVIKNIEDISGYYAKSDLYPEDYITPIKIATNESAPFSTLKDNEKIMSFTVANLAASVGNNIKIGDKIQVIYSEIATEAMGESNTIIYTPDCLKNLKVIDIKDLNAYSYTEKQNNSISYSSGYIPSVITVIVNEEQAIELYKANQTENIHILFIER